MRIFFDPNFFISYKYYKILISYLQKSNFSIDTNNWREDKFERGNERDELPPEEEILPPLKKALFFYLFPSWVDNVSLSVSRFSWFDFRKFYFFSFHPRFAKRGPLINYSPGRKTRGAGVFQGEEFSLWSGNRGRI